MKKLKTLNRTIIVAGLSLAITLAACNGGNHNQNEPRGQQFDRMGIAGVNTVFIPSSEKDAYNAGDPSLDSIDYGNTVIATTNALRSALAGVEGFPGEDLGIPAEAVKEIVVPDVVTLDLSKADGFPNGRKLDDDVIDTALQVTLNRSFASDGISNDSAFMTTFPFLANPN